MAAAALTVCAIAAVWVLHGNAALQERLDIPADTSLGAASATVSGLLFAPLAMLLAFSRPHDPAARTAALIFAAAGFGFAGTGFTVWEPGRHNATHIASNVLITFACAGALQFSLLFPAPTGPLRWLRRRRPGAIRGMMSGGELTLYLSYAALLLAYLPIVAGPEAAHRWYVVYRLVFLLPAIALFAWSSLHPPNPLARAQVRWVLWAVLVNAVEPLVEFGPPLVTGGHVRLVPGGGTVSVLTSILLPLAVCLAVLRYRMFDVDTVVRQTVIYAVLTGLLVTSYLILTFAGSRLAVLVAGPAGAADESVPIISALVIAAVAAPARRRVQTELNRLVYRARTARHHFLNSAATLLERAVSPEELVAFLTDQTAERLGLNGAWLVVSPDAGLPPAATGRRLPAPGDALLDRLAARQGPVLLTGEDLGASGVPCIVPAETELRAWYAAGARLLVPLRTAPGGGTPPADQAATARTATSAIAHPLIGIWVLGGLRTGALPEREDFTAITRVARQVTLLLDYTRLTEAHVRQALVTQDLERARQIQQRLLPGAIHSWPGMLEIAVRLQPARETSGDFYDVLPLDRALPYAIDGHAPLQICVGDVQGKGIGAALVMAVAQSTLRSTAHECTPASRSGASAGAIPAMSMPHSPAGRRPAQPAQPGSPQVHEDAGRKARDVSPAATLSVAGGVLNRNVGSRDFVCCALAVAESDEADNRGPRLRLANAAQVPPLLCRGGRATELVPPGESLPLGILPEPSYQELAVDLEPGDVVVFTSDGLPEAPAATGLTAGWAMADRRRASSEADEFPISPPTSPGELFGFERLSSSAAFWSRHAQGAQSILDGMWSDIQAWCGEESHHDDMTLLVLRVPEVLHA